MTGRVGRGVGPARRPPVRERHVPHASGEERAQDGSELAIIEPPSSPMSDAIRPEAKTALHLVGGRRERERVRVTLDEPVDDVELLERPSGGASSSGRSAGTQTDQNWPPTPPGTEARDVGVESGDVRPKIDARDAEADALPQCDTPGRCGRRSAAPLEAARGRGRRTDRSVRSCAEASGPTTEAWGRRHAGRSGSSGVTFFIGGRPRSGHRVSPPGVSRYRRTTRRAPHRAALPRTA